MNILVAPDSFKGSLTAKRFCDIVEEAAYSTDISFKVTKVPLADGGEGTVEALVLNTGGKIYNKTVTGPLGDPVKAYFGVLGSGETAVIEMASASGLPLVPQDKRNPMITTTYGTGELIKNALDLGCKTIIMGIGGSATNDAGAGMLQALGFDLLDKEGKQIERGAKGLLSLHKIGKQNCDPRLKNVEFLVACDVNNPLYGPNGASYVYGPQKGATKEMLPVMDKALVNFNETVKKYLKIDVSQVPGAGAAGGLGAGLMAFLNAKLRPGFEIVSEIIGLEKLIASGDFKLVITGEGQMNYQTVNGKLPVGVAGLAKKFGIPVIALVGSVGEGVEKVYSTGIDSVISIINKPMSLSEAMKDAEKLLYDSAKQVLRMVGVIARQS